MGVFTAFKSLFDKIYSVCCCGMCQDFRSLDEKLENDKLFNFYHDVVPDADALIRVKTLTLNGMVEIDGEFTNAQMALRKDLINRKIEWTGDWLMDYKYYLWFNHPVLAVLRASNADSFDRAERMSVLFMQCGINSLLSYVIVSQEYACEKGNDKACDSHWPLNFAFAVFLAMIVRLLRVFAECGCVQSCNSCIRRCCEALGKCAMMVFLLKSILAFVITVILALTFTKNLSSYFQAFAISLFTSWFVFFGTAFVFFYYARRCERQMLKNDDDDPIYKLTLEKCQDSVKYHFADRDWRFWVKVVSLIWFFLDDEKDWGWVQKQDEAATVILKAEEVEILIDEDYTREPAGDLKKTDYERHNMGEDVEEIDEVDESEKILVVK